MRLPELLKHSGAWVIKDGVWIVWEEGALFGEAAWVVYQRKPGAFKPRQIMVTDDEEKAVAEFAKAIGVKEGE